MQILNAMQLKAGAKVTKNTFSNLTQPIQFLSEKDKDDDWRASNMDFIELQGVRQLKHNARRLIKNYKLAKGIIEKSDYIVEDDNAMADMIEILTKEDDSALELKFYPIIPNVVNVLTTEFSKRASKIMFRAVDDTSYNEMLEAKKEMITQRLLQDAMMKQQAKLIEMGLEPDSEEAQQMTSQQTLMSLPEIEDHFKKTYRNVPEEWAAHQMAVDKERFKMDELEETGFRDMLITDREFWHFKMMEDDYEVEIWNPVLTFFNKSPESKYISAGNSVGMIEMLSISDVIDKYGYRMNQAQLESLESIYPTSGAPYATMGVQNDGSFYDASKSHEWNTNIPDSLGMKQYNSVFGEGAVNGDIVDWIMNDDSENDHFKKGLLRVSTIYWKTQRKYGHLTKILESGEMIQDIIDENYLVTDKPIYNTNVYKTKTKDNLIFGEHIDWIWLNETWGGVKIGANRPTNWNGSNNSNAFDPIYLGIRNSKPSRVPFQFKGDNSLYGCKLPVEGCVFSDRNTKSVAMVDSMKPFQIGYNIVNNQIADILVDELGTVIVFDQNGLPRHSMGEDWGKGNLAKAYVAMKDFQMLPLDTTITNTENALNFQHYQALDLSQTNRLLSRIQLATYFKAQAFEVIGINPQRLGQQLGNTTATGVEQAVTASYAQTEVYFTQHSDYLMPRVHQMRTDLAQYYVSTKPSVRLQYITSADEKVNFQINGTKLLMRDFNIYAVTNNNSRAIMEQLRSLALNNNTTGASIFDLGNVIKADSIAELTTVLKSAEEKAQAAIQQQQQAEQDNVNAQIESQEKQKMMALQFEADQKEKDRQKDILVAEIRATTSIGSNKSDMNSNSQNDQIDAAKLIQQQDNYREQMNFDREKEVNKQLTEREKLNIQKEELQARKDIANKQLQVAKENKNKYDRK